MTGFPKIALLPQAEVFAKILLELKEHRPKHANKRNNIHGNN